MSMATFPQTIYTSTRSFNDRSAPDMQHGDISEKRLKHEFSLTNVSNIVDPYTLTLITPFDNPQLRFAGVFGAKKPPSISVAECARLLFKEMQTKALPFSFYGPHRFLIYKMLNHMQEFDGADFNSMQLNAAYREQIINDCSPNSTRETIERVINQNINYEKLGFPKNRLGEFKNDLSWKILPKFDSLFDRINGMGITIHDVHATKIEIISLDVKNGKWHARVKYVAQDHFGLDINDISNRKFRQLQFFKIWFILQRFDRFGFRPFFTNMEAIIDMEGSTE